MPTLARAALMAVAGFGLLSIQAGAASAADCQRFGGWGTGALEGFASFMSEAAMKNAAKAKYGDTVKIGKVATKCEVKTVLWECRSQTTACK